MKNFKVLLLSILAFTFLFTACDDDEPSVNEAEVLVEYLESAGGTVVNDFPIMIKSTDVNAAVLTQGDMYIIDIRSADDFNAGHIEGSVNVSANNVLSHYESNNLENYGTVAIVCYSGQTAGWVNGLLRTAGYTNTKDMKWGMCSWTSTTAGSWPGNIGNTYATQFTTDATAKGEAGSYPTIDTGESDGAEILKARVNAVFAEGFGEAKIAASAVFENPDNYYIINYWSSTDYDWGHIPGAIQYTPKESLVSSAFLNTLPTDKTIVVYCYTGQTSAHVAAYLRVLGYDAKSLLFGVNGMSYDEMPGTKWADTEIHDYNLVTE